MGVFGFAPPDVVTEALLVVNSGIPAFRSYAEAPVFSAELISMTAHMERLTNERMKLQQGKQ